MAVLITGASGYIGNRLAHTLAERGTIVHAMARSEKYREWLQHPNIRFCKGDIRQVDTIAAAVKGCEQVYHVAAKMGAWDKDLSLFYEVNVNGTRNVLEAAAKAGVNKIVFTSSSGIYGASTEAILHEESLRTSPYSIHYDITKKQADDVVMEYVNKGWPCTIVNPSKIFGPGHVSHPMAANAIISRFLKYKFTVVPSPGTYKVSYAYIDDVVNGHILAMEKGAHGEHYILGGPNLNYFELFRTIAKLAAIKGRIIKVGKPVVKAAAYMQWVMHRLTGMPIQIPLNAVDYAFNHYQFSSQKAIEQLGYSITPLDAALLQTINYLKQ